MEQAPVTTNRRLQRGDGPIAGVAAGMADYFAIDPIIIRLGLVATTILGGPTVPIVYLAAWLIIPAADADAQAPVAPAAPWATAPPPAPAPAPPAAASTAAPAPAPAGPVATMERPEVEANEAVDTITGTDETETSEPGTADDGTAPTDEDGIR